MKKIKILTIISFVLSLISLITGASFHNLRMNPDNTSAYNLGVNMGISMIVLFAFFLLTGIVLLIIYKKKKK
ncbi:MAG: hypothetical protein WCS80_05085 [Bacilli bacterium]